MKKILLGVGLFFSIITIFASEEITKAENFVKENKCKNLIMNSNFEIFSRKNIPNWWTWKRKDSKGEISWGQNEGVDESGAAILCGGAITIFQDVKNVKEGEKYLVAVMTKKNIDIAQAALSVRFKKNRKWNVVEKSLLKKIQLPEKDTWAKSSCLVAVPKDTDGICIMLSAENLNEEDDFVAFDNVEVYKIQ